MKTFRLLKFCVVVFVVTATLSLPALFLSAQTNAPQNKSAPPSPEQQEVDRLYDGGVQAYQKGNFPEALQAFQSGMEKAQALKDELRTAKFISIFGFVYYRLSQYEKALDYLQRALILFEKLRNEWGLARSLNGIGNIYSSLGQFEKALDYHQRALKLREKLGDEQDIASSLNGIGGVYYRQDQYEKALAYYQRALKLVEKLGNEQDVAANLNNIGYIYDALGQFEKALDFHQRTLKLFEKIGNKQNIAASLNGIGNAYSSLGQFEKALDYHQRALPLFEKMGNEQNIAISLNNLGLVYDSLGQNEKALDFYQRALKRLEKLGNEQDIAMSLNNIGNVYWSQSQFEKALDFHQRALKLNEKIGNEQNIAISLNNIGSVYSLLDQNKKALDYLQRALKRRENIHNQQDIAASLNNLGLVFMQLRRLHDAQHAYQRSLALFENVGQQVGEADEVGAFQQANQGNLYTRYADLMLHQNRVRDAFALIERGRGQGLAKQIGQSRLGLDRFLNPQECAQRQQAADERAAATSLFRAIQNRNVPDPTKEKDAFDRYQQQYTAARTRYREAEHRWRQTRDRLFALHPEYAHLQGAKPPSAQDLQRLSRDNPDTLYLEYAVVDDKTTLLFALRDGKIRAFSLPVGSKFLELKSQAWRTALTSQGATGGNEPQQARELYKALLRPIERTGWLQGKKTQHLVVVGDGPLLDIPFPALLDRQSKRLVERFPVSSTFSLASLTWPNTQHPTPNTIFCAADATGAGGAVLQSRLRGGFGALPHARQEGEAVVNLFPGGFGLSGEKATLAAVRERMGQYTLLHFATHGVADSHNGLLSGLALAAEGGEAGEAAMLEAREIAEMELSARLAVLSACETAQGQKSGGEGLLGLAWAFRAAGVPAIVASQWKVEDEATSQLMVAFYRALKAGKRKDEALREAMLLIKKEKPQPYYWAAFQVIGDTTPPLTGLRGSGAHGDDKPK